MSHVDTAPRFDLAKFLSGVTAQPSAAAADFDRQELEVIQLARHDGLSSLREPTRIDRALHWLFGIERNGPLANPRLEALRRFAVLAWHHGYTLPLSAIGRFKEAGYSIDHVELLFAHIGGDRIQHRRIAA